MTKGTHTQKQGGKHAERMKSALQWNLPKEIWHSGTLRTKRETIRKAFIGLMLASKITNIWEILHFCEEKGLKKNYHDSNQC